MSDLAQRSFSSWQGNSNIVTSLKYITGKFIAKAGYANEELDL